MASLALRHVRRSHSILHKLLYDRMQDHTRQRSQWEHFLPALCAQGLLFFISIGEGPAGSFSGCLPYVNREQISSPGAIWCACGLQQPLDVFSPVQAKRGAALTSALQFVAFAFACVNTPRPAVLFNVFAAML